VEVIAAGKCYVEQILPGVASEFVACSRVGSRVRNGYVRAGTRGHARPRSDLERALISGEIVRGHARAWTRVLHSSFPRNEGVPGSSPGVGFGLFCRAFFCTDNAGTRSAGTNGYII
jgi:hypothetical protein